MKSIRDRLRQRRRPIIILLSLAAITALFTLAAGIDTVQFAPAQPFEISRRESGSLPPFQFRSGSDFVFFILFGTILLVSILLVLRSPQQRKILFKHTLRLLAVALVVIALWILSSREVEEPAPTEEPTQLAEVEIPPFPELQTEKETSEIIIPPAPSPWLGYATTFLVVLFLSLVGYTIWAFTKPPNQPLRDITEIALRDLAAGRAWEDSVIKCYIRMSNILQERRAVSRNIDMTPSEFIFNLERIGLPPQPVRKLTHLFEKARYGSQETATTDASEAAVCLAEILQSLEEVE